MTANSSSQIVTWMWKANLDPFADDEEEEWRKYTEEQNSIIEQAFNKDENGVHLNNYYIDFLRNEQRAIDDSTRRRPIKRIINEKEKWLKCLKKLGAGSYGKVYEGIYRETQKVAYKVTRSQLSLDAIRETNILKTLHHPSIVRYIDVIHTSQHTLLIMELIDGGTLCDFIENKYLSSNYWHDCENMMIDVAYAMSYLHEKNIVHSDLKSDNVLLRRNGKAVLSDFGLSSIIENSDCETGDSNTGAIRWLSPELCLVPPQRCSFASDVWAYGCVILEIATRNLPWMKQYERNRELMKALADKRNATFFQQICREQQAPKKFIEILCVCCTWPKHNRPTFVDIIQQFYTLSDDDFQISKTTSYVNRKGKNAVRQESLYSADEDDER